ncbi:MAG: histidine kinase dimerization/phospho-acceptor domain-containing protein, partial [Gammaproteobacteria bacterium]|nr:histidine kinase dimerization/phospho-acceptor domain-containing protein [Gammaproteobacteria bacterium]
MVGKMTPAILHDPEEVKRRAAELSSEMGVSVQPGFEVFVAKARWGIQDENEWTYICKDGTTFPVLLTVTALREPDGTITGFLGIGKDITERKKIDRMKSEFISTVSHELRTPLTSIRGSLGLVMGGVAGSVSEQMQPLVEIAFKNSDRLVR